MPSLRFPLNRRGFLQSTALLAAGGACARARGWWADEDGLDIGNEPQLFLDDWLIAEQQGLTRTLHRPAKQGLIQEADGSDWQRGDAPTVVRDRAGRFHMYYRLIWEDPTVRDLHPGIGNDKAHWFRRTVGYAVSDDGIRWTKLVLGLFDGPTGFRRAPRERWKDGVFFEPTGFSKENNLGCPVNLVQDLGEFGGVDDPERRYLVNVLYRKDTHNFAEIADAGLYFSADVPDIVGDPEWRKRMTSVWEGPRRGPRGEETHVSGFSACDGEWFVCTQSGFGVWVGAGTGRTISRFTSRDLIDWSKEELVLSPPDDELRRPDDWIEYMGIGVFRAGSAWLGQLVIFHGDRTDPRYQMPDPATGKPIAGVWRKGTTDVRLVVSRDAGRTWQRVGDKEAWIPYHEQEDGFDRLVFGGAPVRVGDELWLYYMCFDGDHLVWNLDGTTYYKNRARIGRVARATMRWDGYASLDAPGTTGSIVTRPLRLKGERLGINARAPRGHIKAEVLDAAGTPLPGFSLAECLPTTGDALQLPVRWRDRERLDELKDRPVRLHFELSDASLYGFQVV